MSKKIAIVFPGQGSQSIGMLAAMAEQYPGIIASTFEEASTILGYDLWKIIQHGPSERLNSTDVTQPALLAASISLWRIWSQEGGIRPLVLSGHSLGEYSALVGAEALSFAEAIRLVADRGRFMQEAIPLGEGAMAAIVGLTSEEVTQLCREVAIEGNVIAPANINGHHQVVIAGEYNAVLRAMDKAIAMGAKLVKRLEVSVPSHCLLMQQAAERLGACLNDIVWKHPKIPVIQNVAACAYEGIPEIKTALFEQLAQPVQWVKCIEKMLCDYPVDVIIECGPGKVLTGLNKRINETVNTLPIAEPKQLREALHYVIG